MRSVLKRYKFRPTAKHIQKRHLAPGIPRAASLDLLSRPQVPVSLEDLNIDNIFHAFDAKTTEVIIV